MDKYYISVDLIGKIDKPIINMVCYLFQSLNSNEAFFGFALNKGKQVLEVIVDNKTVSYTEVGEGNLIIGISVKEEGQLILIEEEQ